MAKESLNPEVIAAVKDIMGGAFDVMFEAYLEQNPEQELTEADLASEIIYAGRLQEVDGSCFEDIVRNGWYILGPGLGVL